MLQKSQSLWEKTNVQNLFRYRPSGTYFARFKIGDKPIRQSLETTVFSVAKQRLPEKIREYRSRHESARAFADGKMTVGDAAEVYLRKVRASASLKPRSKNYREMILGFIKRSWPALLAILCSLAFSGLLSKKRIGLSDRSHRLIQLGVPPALPGWQ